MRGAAAALAAAAAGAAAYGTDCGAATSSTPKCSAGLKVGQLCVSTCGDAAVRPTQSSVGQQLVACKASKYNAKSDKKMEKYLKEDKHVVPGVIGLDGLYITDHHDQVNAICQSDHKDTDVYYCPRLDFSNAKDSDDFWARMCSNSPKLCWLEGADGRAVNASALPRVAGAMALDDPYRSFAGLVRDQGGFIKCSEDLFGAWDQCRNVTDENSPPYLELVWADVLRSEAPVAGLVGTSPAGQAALLVPRIAAGVAACRSASHSGVPGYNLQPAMGTNCAVTESTGCDCKSGP